LVKVKRSLGNQVRRLLRPFGVKLPSCAGAKKSAEAGYQATRNDSLMDANITALLEALASIEAQLAKLDEYFGELAHRNEIAWRLISVPGVGPVTALAFIAAIEDARRFKRTRDIGAYLGLTISKQGDAMARHNLFEAARVLLATVKKRFAP
jgi:transposase